MKILTRRLAVLIVPLLVFAASPVDAQTQPRGRVVGRVVDLSGNFLSGVAITLKGPGAPRIAQSDPAGMFTFDDVVADPAVTYEMTAALTGFETDPLPGIVLKPDETYTVTITMYLGCFAPDLVVEDLWFNYLRAADLVAEVRIDAVTTETIREGHSCWIVSVATANVVNIAKSESGVLQGDTIRFSSEIYESASVGQHFVVFVNPRTAQGRRAATYVAEIVDDSAWLGTRQDESESFNIDPIKKLREWAATGVPRLDSLAFKTGWILLGTLEAGHQNWAWNPAFDFVEDRNNKIPNHLIPRKGDAINPVIDRWVFIKDFDTQREAERNTSPVPVRPNDHTGVMIYPQENIRVEDVVITNDERVWVRVVPVAR